MIGEGPIKKITISYKKELYFEIFQLVVQSCDVSCRAQLIKHPLESGSPVIDNKVLEPRIITIRAFVGARDEETIRKLDKMWRNRRFSFYSITTRSDTYDNFCCEECSHTEGADKLDALEYTIRFSEILKATGRPKQPANEDDASTRNFGTVGA